MAYQNSSIPRFYINMIDWMASNGFMPTVDGLPEYTAFNATDLVFKTLPVIPTITQKRVFENTIPFKKESFVAILGHNMSASNVHYSMDNLSGVSYSSKDVVNNNNPPILYDGFTIETVNMETETSFIFQLLDNDVDINSAANIGSLIIGTYYDMHSPDLNLTMTREMDGVKRIRTKGGSDLVNHKYIKPAMWGDAGAWELYSGTPINQELSRSGRRIWDLSFSYMQDSDAFPKTSALSNLGNADYDVNNWDTNTLLTDNNFYSQVIHKTNGGQLPFIFNPAGGGDSPNNNADMFAICKLDMNSYQFKQVSNGVYNTKIRIKEVW